MNAPLDDEIRFKLLTLLKDEPKLTQREMNQLMGISLGRLNFCVSALAQKGLIRIERFKNNSNKPGYLYQITPSGLKDLAHLTVNFLQLKLKEYEQIKKEIKKLSEQVSKMDSQLCDDPELLSDLKKIT
ncbi:MAG: MarR family EPS-associated transcriptional regulator [Desulfobacter sp.]|nr:MAG: MarR family EPS-associated transcriptional regulator [Desulfobacter sp.]